MSSTIDFIGSRDNPEYVYYNALIINNTVQTTQSSPDPAVVFQDTRDVPILKDSSKYVLSVEDFTLDGALKNLPILIPQIFTPVTDINLTVYTISFAWTDGTNSYQDTQPLIWTPEDKSQFATIPPTGTEGQTETPYYYMYTYSHWVDIVNTALAKAYENVKAVAGANFGGTLCPFFSYDSVNGVFSLSQDVNTSVVPYGQSLPQPYGIPSSVGSSSVGNYKSNEFSYVGYNTNFEALINNLQTFYYADTVQWKASAQDVSLFVIASRNIAFPTGSITWSVGPLPAGTTKLFLGQTTDLVSGVAYTATASDYFVSTITGTLTNTSGTDLVFKAKTNYDLTTFPVTWSGGSLTAGQLVQFPVDVTLPKNTPSPIAVSIPSNTLLYIPIGAGNTITFTAPLESVTYPENVVIPTISAGTQPTSQINSTNKDVLTLTTNVGALPNPFTGILSSSATLYVISTEEQSSTDSLWSPVQSFVITTTQLPIINEMSANPVKLGTANLGYSQAGGNAFNRIVIEVPVDTRYVDYFNYRPKSQTYTGFSPSHEPLRTIDFQIKWRNRLTNALIPVQLYNLGTASVRLLFKRKDVV